MTSGFEQLERELRAAERRQRAQRQRSRQLIGAAPMVLSGAIALSVAVVLLLSGRHAGAPRPEPIGAAAAEREQLVQNVAVMRRQQTKVDRSTASIPPFLAAAHAPGGRPGFHLPQHVLARFGYPALQMDLVRAINAPHGQRVSIAPITYQPSPTSHRRVEGVWLLDNHYGTGPKSVKSLLTHGVAGLFQYVHRHTDLGVILVPDGVAKVELSSFRVVGNPGLTINRLNGIGKAASPVHDNIAVFRLHVLPARDSRIRSGLAGTHVVAQAKWLGASGEVIRRTTTSINVVIPVIGRSDGRAGRH